MTKEKLITYVLLYHNRLLCFTIDFELDHIELEELNEKYVLRYNMYWDRVSIEIKGLRISVYTSDDEVISRVLSRIEEILKESIVLGESVKTED